MSSNGAASKSAAEVRAGLDHPVIDGDGHWVEYFPTMQDELRRIGGEKAADGFAAFGDEVYRNLQLSVEERRNGNLAHEAWWAVPTRDIRDRATAMMPKLLNERMDELGFDFSVLYPTIGLGAPRIADDETRQVACRAFNTYTAERFAPFADRMTPAGVIPMHTPDEAIAELDHLVGELGLKVAMFGSMVARPVPGLVARGSDAVDETAWLDLLGLDSAYDYDPVWQRCRELGISPTFHSSGRGLGFGLRASVSNFTYNHIGHFAAAAEATCKALFIGGVTRRFPDVKFGFLEGGVSWACQLLVDLVEHWEVRNVEALEAVRPENLDLDLLSELAESYADPAMSAEIVRRAERAATKRSDLAGGRGSPAPGIDDFAACEIVDLSDIGELFVDRFWFGCEADDLLASWAFKGEHNAFGARLNATFGSDIGHFDVSDMSRVLLHAHGLVDDGLITDADFRDFTFTNTARLFGEANPAFFSGTSVEAAVAELLASSDDGA